MLGACLFPITLGVSWPRDHLSRARIAVVAALLALGYFCHLVSLGLTVFGLIVLAVAAPVPFGASAPSRTATVAGSHIRRLHTRGRSGIVLPADRAAARKDGARMEGPVQSTVAANLGGAARIGQPGVAGDPRWHALDQPFSPSTAVFAPVVWLGVAVILWWYGRITAGSTMGTDHDRRGWFVLAVLLIFAGVAGPDSLGTAHGELLPQRVVLLGLAALVPIFDVDISRWSGRGAPALAAAVILQSTIVWDYAFHSDSTAGQIIRAPKPSAAANGSLRFWFRPVAGFDPIPCSTPKTGWASIRPTWSGTTTRPCTITSQCTSATGSTAPILATWSGS